MQAALISSAKAPNAGRRVSSVSTYQGFSALNASVSVEPAGFGTASLVIVLAISLQLLGAFSPCQPIRAKLIKLCQLCLLLPVVSIANKASRLIND